MASRRKHQTKEKGKSSGIELAHAPPVPFVSTETTSRLNIGLPRHAKLRKHSSLSSFTLNGNWVGAGVCVCASDQINPEVGEKHCLLSPARLSFLSSLPVGVSLIISELAEQVCVGADGVCVCFIRPSPLGLSVSAAVRHQHRLNGC